MKTIRYIILIAAVLGQAAIMHAEFRAGIAVQIVTPNPLLPVSGGVGPSNPVTKKYGDLTVRAIRRGDQYLLCSDGLSGHVDDEEMANLMLANSPQNAARKLVILACDRGGDDNITTVIARVDAQ